MEPPPMLKIVFSDFTFEAEKERERGDPLLNSNRHSLSPLEDEISCFFRRSSPWHILLLYFSLIVHALNKDV